VEEVKEMQNLYPLFERNRILKKELLWSLRDYSFSQIQLEYQEYGQGIIQGCLVQVQGSELVVGPGMIKYGGFICLMMEEQRIEYGPKEQTQYLKLKIETDRNSPDYIVYDIQLLLDLKGKQSDNEFELCRFNLRKGARLRDRYKDFFDMETVYDTMNVLHADWGGLGGSAVAPAVIRYFAESVLENRNSLSDDGSFAYFCLSQTGAVPVKILADYCNRRIGKPPEDRMDAVGFYRSLCAILDQIQKEKETKDRDKKERRRILVD
jgi:hypothetical protein